MSTVPRSSFKCFFHGHKRGWAVGPPIKDGQKKWHVTGSRVACPKPHIKKILALFESLRESISEATLVWGLPLRCYVGEKCCTDKCHIDNFGDDNYAKVFGQACEMAKACLAVAFPSAIIFDQLATFSAEEEDIVFEELLSSSGLPIWAKGDPVHLTPTAYGDVAVTLMDKLISPGSENQTSSTRKGIKSDVTRSQITAKEAPTCKTARQPHVAVEGLAAALETGVAGVADPACRLAGGAPAATGGALTKQVK